MTSWPRIVLGSCSMASMLAVTAVAIGAAPERNRFWLLVVGSVAVVATLQSVISERGGLTPALLLGVVPVVALAAEGSPSWLIIPLAILLLMAGELNSSSWQSRVPAPARVQVSRRLLEITQLGLLGLGGSLAVYLVGQVSWSGGTGAVVVGAMSLAGLGIAVFRRGGNRS